MLSSQGGSLLWADVAEGMAPLYSWLTFTSLLWGPTSSPAGFSAGLEAYPSTVKHAVDTQCTTQQAALQHRTNGKRNQEVGRRLRLKEVYRLA